MNAAAVDAVVEPELPAMPRAQTSATTRVARLATLRRHLDSGAALGCAVLGRLAAPARLLPDPDDETFPLIEVLVHQQVAQHPQAWPVLALWDYPRHLGAAMAYQRAAALANALTTGAEVVVRGRGLEAAHHEGKPCLRLMDVMGVARIERTRETNPAPAGADLFAQGGLPQ